jgi:sensor domain CHASE-containing protein
MRTLLVIILFPPALFLAVIYAGARLWVESRREHLPDFEEVMHDGK